MPQLPEGKQFRFLFCSGKFAEWDQEKPLHFMLDTRRVKVTNSLPMVLCCAVSCCAVILICCYFVSLWRAVKKKQNTGLMASSPHPSSSSCNQP